MYLGSAAQQTCQRPLHSFTFQTLHFPECRSTTSRRVPRKQIPLPSSHHGHPERTLRSHRTCSKAPLLLMFSRTPRLQVSPKTQNERLCRRLVGASPTGGCWKQKRSWRRKPDDSTQRDTQRHLVAVKIVGLAF